MKRVVQETDKVGALEYCNSVGQVPQKERQVKYLKGEWQQQKVEDPIFQITEK